MNIEDWNNHERMSWDEYFIRQAMLAAAKSKDPSTKVGVVLVKNRSVIATGFNGFPRGVRELAPTRPEGDLNDAASLEFLSNIGGLDQQRWSRPDKYRWTEHAERNAIFQAARLGIPTEGASMYMNTAGQPCSDCSRAIIQAGIREVVSRNIGGFHGAGEGTHYHCGDIEKQMFAEAGVVHRLVPDFAPDYRYTNPNRG